MTERTPHGEKHENDEVVAVSPGKVPVGATSLMNLFDPPSSPSLDNDKIEENPRPADNIEGSPPPRVTIGGTSSRFLLEHDVPPSPPKHAPPMQRPPLPTTGNNRPDLARQSTARRSNSSEKTALLSVQDMWLRSSSSTSSLPKPVVSSFDTTPKTGSKFHVYDATATPSSNGNREEIMNRHRRLSSTDPMLKAIRESSLPTPQIQKSRVKQFCTEHLGLATWIGSFMMVLYHVVFCLAFGSSIIRPSTSASILGITTKMASVGVIFSAPLFVFRLGREIPALYATTDLFLAPFIAHLAQVVDGALQKEPVYDDDVFFATFSILVSMALAASASMLVLASKFQLANLGNYLPYSVLCGFFSAVGIMILQLAFTVDTNGQTWTSTMFSSHKWHDIKHHAPSVFVGLVMKWLGPKHPFWISSLVLTTIFSFYVMMWLTGTSLDQAQDEEWFWPGEDLVYHTRSSRIGFDQWAPPAPFGVWNSLADGKVHWGAVREGMPIVCALSFLYLLRCSLHATAVKKSMNNLVKVVPKESSKGQPPLLRDISSNIRKTFTTPDSGTRKSHVRNFSEAVDLDLVSHQDDGQPNGNDEEADDSDGATQTIQAKKTKMTLQDILVEYAFTQFLVAFAGGFGNVPCIAVGPTMYKLGADGAAPQIGAAMLLLTFYLTNFQLVEFIPKAAFSSLLVLCALDMFITWFIKSFHRTREKEEWMVVPLIVAFAFVVGLLNAVFLGVAISTFIFVASFFRTSVVKYAATGLSIRSTIERHVTSATWLDQNGDLIYVLVLQSYLFFGNASSILSYVGTMFEEPDIKEKARLAFPLPRRPKFVILDMTLISGLDTSSVDVLADIKNLCLSNDCKLFLAGLTPRIRSVLALGGVQQEKGKRSGRSVRMFSDLDAALGKAEDILIENESSIVDHHRSDYPRARMLSEGDNGFRYALRQIDEQHGTSFAHGLVGLQEYTRPVELRQGDPLFDVDGKPLHVEGRGLYFIESGMIKTERDSSQTLSRGAGSSLRRRFSRTDISQMNARTGPIGQQAAALKAGQHESASKNMRLARIGPGWVVGTIEGVTGLRHTGSHVALTACRLHHLPYAKMQEIEDADPVLVLCLYKMLAHLSARRQENTIEQAATLHSIMTSRAQGRPLSRVTQGAIASIQHA